MKDPNLLISEVFNLYREIPLSFQNANYWETLRTTYVRTVSDIQDIATNSGKHSTLRILEIGAFCGTVATALRLCGFDVTACDLPLFMNDGALADHYQKQGIRAVSGNLSTLPLDLETGTFDIVICCEVIEHLNFNPLPAFCEFNRLLKPGGSVYIGTPNQSNIVKRLLLANGKSIHNPVRDLVRQLDMTASFSIGLHWKEYTMAELSEVFQVTGFKTSRCYYCHTNECSHPNFLRRALVHAMYACFPSFLPAQVAIGVKESECEISDLRAKAAEINVLHHASTPIGKGG